MPATQDQGTTGLRTCVVVTAAIVFTMGATVLGGRQFVGSDTAAVSRTTLATEPGPKIAQLEAEVARLKVAQPGAAEASGTRIVTALDLAYKHLGEQARDALVSSKGEQCVVKPFPRPTSSLAECICLWKDIQLGVPLDPQVVKRSDGRGSEDKAMVRLELMSHGSGNTKDCVVYGMGIATDSSFEMLAAQHCTTFGFDCTVAENSPVVANKPFVFKKICIGAKTDINAAGNVYGGGQSNLKFESLEKVMTDLGHTSLDVLKFDIEGSEWELLDAFTKVKDKRFLPKQLLFELHTEGANEAAVPPQNIKGKGKLAVHEILLALHDVGYRVINRDINAADCTCAEIAMVLMNER